MAVMMNNPLSQRRSLNDPLPIVVKADPSGNPTRVGAMPVMSVADQWRIDDEWWRQEPLSRMYYSVVLENGRKMTVYQDLIKQKWYQQNY